MGEDTTQKPSFWRNLALALSKGAAAYGQGMTGTPFLTNLLAMEEMRNKELKEQRARKVMEDLIKKIGLYDTGGASTDPFSAKPISPYEIGKVDLDTGYPSISYKNPREMQGEQFQQDIGRFKASQAEYGQGAGMTKEKFTLMPREGRASFIKARMANFPGARGAMQELRPSLGGLTFTRDVEGKYKQENIPAAERPTAIAKAEAVSKRNMLTDSTKIREEFLNRPEVKEYTTIKTQVQSMDTLLTKAIGGNIENKVALDQALITMYNKLTDPNSVVRESEYARTPENLPLVNRLKGAIQKVSKGGAGLTDSDRKALVWGAKVIADERGKTYDETLQGYVDLAGQYGIDVPLITRGLKSHKPYFQTQEVSKGFISPRQGGVNLQTTPKGNKFKIIQ